VSADGGRVKVDFNHPLSGKKLEYEIEIKREIIDTVEKIKSIVGYMTALEWEKINVKISEKGAEINIDAKGELPTNLKKQIADLTIKWVKGIEKVRFVDEYSG
jgi:peptidylprolyl isomerase/FKBP-type peptidyl-prolyl cis-trans isomerase SlyD